MTTIYTSDELSRIQAQIKALVGCIEKASAYIRYWEALRDEMIAGGQAFFEEFVDQNYMVGIDISQEDMQALFISLKAPAMRENLIKAYSGDIEEVRKVLKMMRDILDGTEDGLRLITLIKNKIVMGDYIEMTANEDAAQVMNATNKHYLETLRISNNDKYDPAVIKAYSIMVAEERYQKNLKIFSAQQSDLKFYKELEKYLLENVFERCEKNFIYKYVIFEVDPGSNLVGIRLSDAFTDLVTKNKKLRQNILKEISERHEAACREFPEYKDELSVTDAYLIENGVEEFRPLTFTTDKELLEVVRQHHFAQELLAKINEQDSQDLYATVVSLRAAKQTSKDKSEKQKARDKPKPKSKKEDKKKVVNPTSKQGNTDVAMTVTETPQVAEIATATAKELRDKIRLEKTKRKAERTRLKEEKIREKSLRHQKAIKDSQPIEVESSGKISQSKFKLPIELVREKADLLDEILADDVKKIRYSRAKAIIEALHGVVVEETGSSHKYVLFDSHLYQEFNTWEEGEEDTSVKYGLVKPHGKQKGSTWLKHNDLRLLRETLQNVLPDDWQNSLKDSPKKDGYNFASRPKKRLS